MSWGPSAKQSDSWGSGINRTRIESVKLLYGNEIRRIPSIRVATIRQLVKALCECYPQHIGQRIYVTYVDDEGDHVTIFKDEELAEAFQVASKE